MLRLLALSLSILVACGGPVDDDMKRNDDLIPARPLRFNGGGRGKSGLVPDHNVPQEAVLNYAGALPLNGSFENFSKGLENYPPDNWNVTSGAWNTNFESSTSSRSGGKCIRVMPTAGNFTMATDMILADTFNQVEVSFWFKATTLPSTAVYLTTNIIEYDSDGIVINTQVESFWLGNYFGTTPTPWTNRTYAVSLLATTKSIRFSFGRTAMEAAGMDLLIDDVRFDLRQTKNLARTYITIDSSGAPQRIQPTAELVHFALGSGAVATQVFMPKTIDAGVGRELIIYNGAVNGMVLLYTPLSGELFDTQLGGTNNFIPESNSVYKFVVIGTSWRLLSKFTPTIAALYSTNTGSVTNGGFPVINYGNAEISSPYVTTGAAWRFTAPVAGNYMVSAALSLIFPNPGTNSGAFVLDINKNGGGHRRLGTVSGVAVTGTLAISGAAIVPMAAGDYININTYQVSGGTRSVEASFGSNFVSINKVN